MLGTLLLWVSPTFWGTWWWAFLYSSSLLIQYSSGSIEEPSAWFLASFISMYAHVFAVMNCLRAVTCLRGTVWIQACSGIPCFVFIRRAVYFTIHFLMDSHASLVNSLSWHLMSLIVTVLTYCTVSSLIVCLRSSFLFLQLSKVAKAGPLSHLPSTVRCSFSLRCLLCLKYV